MRRGGRDTKKSREATFDGADGVVTQDETWVLSGHTVCAFGAATLVRGIVTQDETWILSDHPSAPSAQPPVLTRRGIELAQPTPPRALLPAIPDEPRNGRRLLCNRRRRR